MLHNLLFKELGSLIALPVLPFFPAALPAAALVYARLFLEDTT